VADEVVVNLMAQACGVTYAQAVADGAERRMLGNVAIPVATRDVLIRTKNTPRDSDRSDVGFLRRQIEEEQSRTKR